MLATLVAFGLGGEIGGAILNGASLVVSSVFIGWQFLKNA